MNVRVLRWVIVGLLVVGGVAFLAVGANSPADPFFKADDGPVSLKRTPFGDFTEIGFRIEGGEPPDEFKGAQEAMRDAKEAIGQGNLDSATQQQSLALDKLRKGAQSLAEQMMEGGESQAGQGPGNNGRDPLGRPDRSNRPDLGLSVKVPDEIDIQRAREVLDELRRRLGDPARPTIELDYLERLIKPF